MFRFAPPRLVNYGLRSCLALSITYLLTANVQAGILTFDKAPNGSTPTDNSGLGINDAYHINGVAVTFGFDTVADGTWTADTPVIFEQVGGSDTSNGFQSYFAGGHDVARPGASSSLGDFFLRQPNAIGAFPEALVIDYDQNVSALSGEIWDIDTGSFPRFEQWKVSAFTATGALVDSTLSPQGLPQTDVNSLDGLPWTFSLSGNGIRKVTIEFVGTTSIVGFAFDNFNPTAAAVPEPTSFAILGLGALSLVALRRRRMGVSSGTPQAS